MRSIIKRELADGSFEYLHRDFPRLEFIRDERLALRMDFDKALRISLAMGTMGIRHSIVTKKEWEPVETSHICLTDDK